MIKADLLRASSLAWISRLVFACACVATSSAAYAAGTPVGTIIENTATVSFDVGGSPITLQTNTTTVTVVERIDVDVTVQSAQVLVAASDTNQALLFRVTNTGNGTETFQLAIDTALGGDDFDPVPAVPPIYFDTDGSGDLNVGDVAYTPGTNDPVLAADAAVDVFLVTDIPAGVANGNIGLSQLTATSATGTGAPGTEYAGQGDGGVDAIVGTSGGEDLDTGEYLVSDVQVNVVKAQVVADPFGGAQPIPGATITYTITVEVLGTGTATASAVRDLVPTYTTYVPASITLNAVQLTDAIDADAGEIDTSGVPTVVVRLGDLTAVAGIQTVVFQVTID